MWWSDFLPSFKRLPVDALRTSDPNIPEFAAGISYKTFAVSPPVHLRYLLDRCLHLGAQTCAQNVTSIPDLFLSHDPALQKLEAVVNCAGLGGGQLTGDTNLFPTKGQTLIVRGAATRIATRAGQNWEALVIPRPGADETLLGGCKIEGVWSVLLLYEIHI